MSFVISDCKTIAESWFDETLSTTDILIWGNEFIQRIVDNRLWLEAEKVFSATVIPSTDPTVAASGSGSFTGDYLCKVTFVDADGGESNVNSGVVTVTASSDGQLDWSAIPTRTGCTRKLYRTRANGSIYYYLATIADAVTTTYTDTTADASLTVPMNIKTKYTLPTTFLRAKSVVDVYGNDYKDYVIRNRQIQFILDGDYVLTYVPVPTKLAAITGAGNEVPLPDILQYALAEYLIFKHCNVEADDEDMKKMAVEYEARYKASLKQIYDDMQLDNETESFQVDFNW